MRTRVDRLAPAEDDRELRIARKRFARRQWARRWLVWRVVLAVVLTLSLLAGAVWLVFFSSVLAVKGVRVEGAGVLDPREVRDVAAVPTGSPLASVDLDRIAARLSQLPAVDAVDVSRAWPDHVLVDLTERVAVAVVERDGAVRGVDGDGVVFRRYPSRPPGLPLLRTGPRTSSDALAEATRVVDALPVDLADRVDYVEVQSVDTITLRLRDGRSVLWGSAEESDNKAEVLDVLLDQKASVYDVSVPGRPVIRP